MNFRNSEAKGNISRKLILIRLCFLSEAGSRALCWEGCLGKAENVWRCPLRMGRHSTACLPSMVCKRPSSTELHRVRRTQWLYSKGKGLQNHYDKRLKTRQERRGCQTIEKIALKGPVTTMKSNLGYSGEMSMSGKENLLDRNSNDKQAVIVLK